jgi:hypothetical protein
MSDLLVLLLVLFVICWLCSKIGYRPGSIREAAPGSFLAYKRDGGIEYREDVSDDDAGECAADRLCERGGYVRVEHKFEDGSTTVYTSDSMQHSGW